MNTLRKIGLMIIPTLLISFIAYAGTQVDQGAPGHQGGWPVTLTGTSTVSSSQQQACSATAQSVVSVGVAAVSVPTSRLASSTLLVFCNSIENAGSPKVKVLLSGTPVMGNTTPGDALRVGDCVAYAVGSSVTPKVISDTASTAVTTYECAP